MRYLLVQGDCRKVLLYVKTGSIDQIITSPPYWMMAKYGRVEGEIGTKGTLEQYVRDLLEVFVQCHRVLKSNGSLYLNIDNTKRVDGFVEFSAWDWIPLLRQIGFKLVQTLIWVDRGRRELKNPRMLDHHYEPIFIFAKGRDYTFNWQEVANFYDGDVWEIQGCYITNENESVGDVWDRSGVATFPVELIKMLMSLGSNQNETVLDPFAGSGTVMDVAGRLRRNSIAVEINLDYCERIMKRCFKQDQNEYRFITLGELERGKS